MTLQIGMLGRDGLVVVGDTWQFVEPKNRPWYGFDAPKIRVAPNKRIGVAGAHNMDVFVAIADQIIRELSNPCENRTERIESIGRQIAAGEDSECLVAFADPWPSLYRFGHSRTGEVRCEEIYGSFAIGDHGNPAAWYWTKRFYDISLSCQQLSRLGALCVVSAAKISNGPIGGLDGFTCGTSGVRLWSREESISLEREMKSAEDGLGGILEI